VAYIVHVEAIRKPQVIGYVTKYLMKSLTAGEKGIRREEREAAVIGLDETGKVVEERQSYTVELVSRARRIRYSRHFFPEKVSDLRARLFAELEQQSMEQSGHEASAGDAAASEVSDTAGIPGESDTPVVKRSSWALVQCEEFTQDYKEYKRRCRKALLEALIDLHEGRRNLSRRVINIWAYQRNQRRWAS
jgi:hypothetical protein